MKTPRRALVALCLALLSCSSERPAAPPAPTCGAGTRPTDTGCVVLGGRLVGKAVFADASLHAGIEVALLGTSSSATTDSTGAFALDALPAGARTLRASASGYRAVTVEVAISDGQDTDAGTLTLVSERVKTATLAGKVLVPDGRTDQSGTLVFVPGALSVAFTRADGSFALPGLDPGTVSFVARRDGFVDVVRDGLALGEGEVKDLGTLRFDAKSGPGELAGKVTLAGASTDVSGTLVTLPGTGYAATTARDGSFRIGAVVAGTYELVASRAGFASKSVAAVAVKAGETTTVPPLDLDAANTATTGVVSGAVTLAGSNTAAGGVTVYLEGTSASAITGADGKYAISGVAPGTWDLAAFKTGFVTARQAGVAVTAGKTYAVTTLDLAADPSGATTGDIAGRVRKLGRTDNSGIQVSLSGGSLAAPRTATSDASGAYTFTAVPQGVYTLAFSATGYQPASVANVFAMPGTFRVADATLAIGVKIADATDLQHLFGDGRYNFFRRFGERWLHDATTNRFARFSTADTDVLFFDSQAGFATIKEGLPATFSRLDLSTLARVALTPAPASELMPAAFGALFTDSAGDLYAVQASQAVATKLLGSPCAGARLWYAYPAEKTGWTDIAFDLGACSASLPLAEYLYNPALNKLVGPLRNVLPGAATSFLVSRATTLSATGAQTLASVDLATGAVTDVRTNVVALQLVEDGTYLVLHSRDATTSRVSVGKYQPATRAWAEVVSDVADQYGFFVTRTGGPAVVLSKGANQDAVLLDWAAGTTSTLLAGPGPMAMDTNRTSLGLVNGAGQGALYDTGTGVVTSVGGGLSGLQSRGDAGFEFTGPGGVLRVFPAATKMAVTLCASGTGSSAARVDRASPDGRRWAYACSDGRVRIADLVSGVTRLLGPAPSANPTFGWQWLFDDEVRVASFSYSSAAVDRWACTGTCMPVYDSQTDQVVFPSFGGQLYALNVAASGAGLAIGANGTLHFAFDATQVRKQELAAVSGRVGLGASGRFAVVGMVLSDVANLTQTNLQDFSVIATITDAVLMGTQIVRLDTGARIPLSRANPIPVTTPAPATAWMLFTTDDGVLHRFTLAQGLTDVAPSVDPRSLLIGSTFYLRTHLDAAGAGRLQQVDPATGALTQVLSGVVIAGNASGGPEALVYANTSGGAGDLYRITAIGAPVDLKVRAVVGGQMRRSLERVVVQSITAGAETLSVAKLDGSGGRVIGGRSDTFELLGDGSRAYFASGDVLMAEDLNGGDSMGIERYSLLRPITGAPLNVATTFPGLVFYAVDTTSYPDSQRNGLYFAKLP